METTMNQVFELFLKAAEEHPEMSAEELIAANAEQWGIDAAKAVPTKRLPRLPMRSGRQRAMK